MGTLGELVVASVPERPVVEVVVVEEVVVVGDVVVGDVVMEGAGAGVMVRGLETDEPNCSLERVLILKAPLGDQ